MNKNMAMTTLLVLSAFQCHAASALSESLSEKWSQKAEDQERCARYARLKEDLAVYRDEGVTKSAMFSSVDDGPGSVEAKAEVKKEIDVVYSAHAHFNPLQIRKLYYRDCIRILK